MAAKVSIEIDGYYESALGERGQRIQGGNFSILVNENSTVKELRDDLAKMCRVLPGDVVMQCGEKLLSDEVCVKSARKIRYSILNPVALHKRLETFESKPLEGLLNRKIDRKGSMPKRLKKNVRLIAELFGKLSLVEAGAFSEVVKTPVHLTAELFGKLSLVEAGAFSKVVKTPVHLIPELLDKLSLVGGGSCSKLVKTPVHFTNKLFSKLTPVEV